MIIVASKILSYSVKGGILQFYSISNLTAASGLIRVDNLWIIG